MIQIENKIVINFTPTGMLPSKNEIDQSYLDFIRQDEGGRS